MHIRDVRGWSVKAVTRSLWITQKSDSRDIVLDEGETFFLDREGSVLVTAFGGAIVCLEKNGTEEIEPTSQTASRFSSLLSLTNALFPKVQASALCDPSIYVHAMISARDANNVELAKIKVSAGFN